jgi:uncharacterized membrane protein
MINLLLLLLILVIVFAVIFWITKSMGLEQPYLKIVLAVEGLIFLIVIIVLILMPLIGHTGPILR